MDKRPIGIFDSGLGGLTAVKELEQLLPNEQIIYFGDTGRVPYGTRGRDTIIKYSLQDIRFLKSFDVKAIVIACGTVSSVAFHEICSSTKLPVIGVVEPTAAAAVKKTQSGRIGVIATSATIGSGSFKNSILSFMPGAQVKSRACPLFVPLVENGYFGRENKLARLAAHDYLDEFAGKIDTMIFGCTHYPLLRGVIEDLLPGVALIDAGLELARAAAARLREAGLLADADAGSAEKNAENFYVSDSTEDFERLAGIFLEHPVRGRAERIEIDRF